MKRLNFNDKWTFFRSGESGRAVTLPHDAMLEEKRDSACVNGKNSGYFPGGKYHYTKKFNIDPIDAKKEIRLFFEAVYRNAEIFINGKKAGEHKYGFTEFTVDISDSVSVGENSVEVLVDNSLEPNCRWYSGSGIYRSVWLEIKEKVHPTYLKIKTVSYDPAVIEVQTDGELVEIYDGEKLIASGKAGEYTVENAKLWSDETPYLYKAVAKLGNERIETTFGIRKLEWSAKTGLLVNGRETLLRGGCIHHDNGVLGACTYADAEKRRIRILKEAGYNAIRSAHNPAPRAMLDACDQLGMYVMDEAFDGWYIPKTYHDYSRVFDGEWQGDLTAMVEKDFNHPSVIMYSIGNEVSETATEKGVETCGKLADFARSLDNTRPVTAGINVLLNVYSNMGMGVYRQKGEYKPEPIETKGKGYREKKTGSAFFNAMAQRLGALMFFMSKGKKGDKATKGAAEKLDIIGLNYASSRYEPDTKKYPDRMMVGSETMVADLPYNWEQVKKHKAIVGDFAWAAWDYLGEACIGDWTYHSYKGLPLLAGSGTVDITGKIGAEAYFQQVVWGLRKKPFIGVRPMNHAGETASKSAWRFTDCIDSWNWQPYEGKTATVEVYAQGEKVRLILNDREIGEKKLKNFKAIFKVKYRQGSLTAIAYGKDGKEIARHRINSGTGVYLKVLPEREKLKAGSDELLYVPIAFCDHNGQLIPYLEREIRVQAEGVRLLGLGSALCKTNEKYTDDTHTAFRGRALAVFKPENVKGTAKITVFAKGCVPKTFDVEII